MADGDDSQLSLTGVITNYDSNECNGDVVP